MFLGIKLDDLFLWLFYTLIFMASAGVAAAVAWFFEGATEKLDDWLMGGR